ncbi:unnamed protein product [Allacma fusca]|uniref:Uncharacterized protein n=1 Tax=Allacma fusca TaxID=39272 RepID=A0A8J2PSC3_9HEXA|nr:unnamed protein product [Allacma fusca]
MSDSPGGRPRRTRQSGRLSSINSTPVSNPYKKPTYLAGREKKIEVPVVVSTPSTGRGRGRGRGRPPGSGRGGSSRGRNSRPECVATRTDTKKSASSRGKKRRRGGYNTHDYHYGSDFDSDQIESEPEQPPSDSDSNSVDENIALDDTVESDSDYSVASSRLVRLPSPPVPVWLDEDNSCTDDLEIPQSSDDLLLPRELVIKAVSIYEPIRRFHQLVRLTPFRFEDFCAALSTDEQNVLLAEVHIQLLKAILREEEANGTVFGPNDCKDSVQATLFFMDNMTWCDCLRSYIESDSSWADIAKEMSSVEYPFCGPEVRIKILGWLVDIFLATNLVRESLVSQGNIRHEDHCRLCNRLGELVCCETCPAVYHLGCIDPPLPEDDPPDDWKCTICVKNKISGVADCVSDMEKAGLLIRHERLGYDRHGRKYWFLVRRILVESDDGKEVWYYSTMYQVEELLNQLDTQGYEAELYDAIAIQKDEIYRHMAITEKVTSTMNTQHRKTYLEAENALLKKLHEKRLQAKQLQEEERLRQEEEILKAKRLQEEERHRQEDEVKRKEEEEKKKIREDRLNRRNRNKYGYAIEDFEPLTPSSTHENSHLDDEEGADSKNLELDSKDIKSEKTELDGESNEISKSESMETQVAPEVDSKDSASTNKDLSKTPSSPSENKNGKTANADAKELPVVKSETDETEEPQQPVQPADSTSCTSEKDREIVTRSKTGSLTPKTEEKEATSSSSARKSKALLLDIDSEERMTRLKSTGLYKLGQEGSYRSYINSYSTDNLALSKAQHNEERDRKRHMSHKFSLTTASECKWSGSQHGLRASIVGTLRATLLSMENSVPGTLMHVNWSLLRKAWVSAVAGCVSCRDFSKAMIAFAACLRPSVFNTAWSEGGGHVKLIRMTALEREERKKIEKRDKKDRDDEEDRLRVLPQFVKYSIRPKHQVWKQKGEEYRLHGRWGWIWMSTSRPAKPKDFRKLGLLGGPYKHVIQVKSDTGKIKTMLIDPNVFDKLMAKRSATSKKSDNTMTGSISSTSNLPTSSVVTNNNSNSVSNCQNISNKKDAVECEHSSDESCVVPTSPNVVNKNCESSVPSVSDPVEKEEKIDEEHKEEDKEPKKEAKVGPDEKRLSENGIKMETEDDVKPHPSSEDQTMDTSSSETETQKIDLDNITKDCTQQVDARSDDETPIQLDGIKKEIDGNKDSKGTVAENEINNSDGVKGAEDKHDEVNKDDSRNKFRTELINVSLGIQSANRIIYPKLAHRVPILEGFLSRRIKLQAAEEKALCTTFGQENIESLKQYQQQASVNTRIEEEMAKLEHAFPLAASYSLKCYSYECKMDANEPPSSSNSKCKCYSPMCRLKFVIQDSQRRKVEKNALIEKEKMDKLKKEVDEKRVYTKSSSAEKVYLKKLPEHIKKKRTPVKYPVTSGFRSIASKKPSILVLPQYELRKLARAAGRTFTPVEFASNPKPGNNWAWPYPCGRPYFKTSWQYRTVHAVSLASAALQLRILYASVRWDDIQMKPPNLDGKNQVTTDMEIITTEILNHRIMGRFAERIQYLRRKQTVPIDAPKTIREVTPSRSGLRKRKRAESPDKTDPLIVEEWVDEDKVELWEIRLYGDKQDRKIEKKIDTPTTRTKTGVALTRPEKWDPSTTPTSSTTTTSNAVSATKAADLMREQYETELKMQRAVHLSKRDNHVKNNNTAPNAKSPMPTASQQLQQQNAAAGLPANPRSYGGTNSNVLNAAGSAAKKIIIAKSGATTAGSSGSTPDQGSTPMILNRKVPLVRTPNATATQATVQTKTTEIVAKIFPTPQGQRLVFQSQPHELTQTVLAQIQAQLQGVTGLLPGSTISFQIQQPVSASSPASAAVSSTSLNAGTPTQSTTASPVAQKLPISSLSSASSPATTTGRITQSSVLTGQQMYKTADGKIQAIQLQPATTQLSAAGQQQVVVSQSVGNRLNTPLVFKKVIRNAKGAEEILNTSTSITTVPTNVVSSVPTTMTPKKQTTETVTKIIQQGGQTHRIIFQGNNAAEIGPQLISQIQSQIQGMHGIPPGTPIPLQIQTAVASSSSMSPIVAKSPIVSSTSALPIVAQSPGDNNKPSGKIQLSVLVPGQQVGQRVLIPGQQVLKTVDDKLKAIQPHPVQQQQPGIIRVSQSQVVGVSSSPVLAAKSALASTTSGGQIVKFPPGGMMSGQQFVKTVDGKLQAFQVQLQPSQQQIGQLQQVIINPNMVGRVASSVNAVQISSPATISSVRTPFTTVASSTGNLKVQPNAIVNDQPILKTSDGKLIQIRPSIGQQVTSVSQSLASPYVLKKVVSTAAAAAASTNASAPRARLATPTNALTAATKQETSPSTIGQRETNPGISGARTNEIIAKVVQTTQGLKFVLHTNGNELTPALIQQIQNQIQGMQAVPGATICFQIKTPEQASTISANRANPTSSPITRFPSTSFSESPATSAAVNSPVKMQQPSSPAIPTPTKPSDAPVTTAQTALQQLQQQQTSTAQQPVSSNTNVAGGRLTNPIVLKKVTRPPPQQKVSQDGQSTVSASTLSTPNKPVAPSVMEMQDGKKPNEIISKVFQSGQQPRIVVQGNPAELTPQLLLQIQNQLQGMQVLPPGTNIPFEIQSAINSTAGSISTTTASKIIGGSSTTPAKPGGKIQFNVILPQQQPQVGQFIKAGEENVPTVPSQDGSDSSVQTTPAARSPMTHTVAAAAASKPNPISILSPAKPQQSPAALSVSDGKVPVSRFLASTPSVNFRTSQVLGSVETPSDGSLVGPGNQIPNTTPVPVTPTKSAVPIIPKNNLSPVKLQRPIISAEQQVLETPDGKITGGSTQPALNQKSPLLPQVIKSSPGVSQYGGTTSPAPVISAAITPKSPVVSSASSPIKFQQSSVMSDQRILKVLDGKIQAAQSPTPQVPSSVTPGPTPPPAEVHAAATPGSLSSNDVLSLPSAVKSASASVANATDHVNSNSQDLQQQQSLSKGSKKKYYKGDTSSPVKNSGQKTPPKLISTLFRHKELLKKDIFKKRGLLEKELHIDIQKELHEDFKSTSVTPSETTEVPSAAKAGQKRKASDAKGSTKSIAAAGSNAKKKKKNKLYCICQTPYDNSKFYVGCDVCSNWFHGDCIGITEQMSDSLSEYICDACQDDSNKVYCLCRQPYDESQFYICCDTCQDWFHGRCVGVLQAESSQIDEYVCPNCDSTTPLNHANLKPLSYEDYPLLTKLLKQIQAHKAAWPFLEPVDPTEARNYYRVIKEPMDLRTVEFRTEEKCYSRLRDFIGDITKIFDNCRYYNPAESAFYKAAESLESFFAQKIMLLRQRLV